MFSAYRQWVLAEWVCERDTPWSPTPELTAPPRRGPNSEPKPLGGCGRTPGWAADLNGEALALGF